MEILGKARIFVHAVRKQQRAQEKEQRRIADDEEIDPEGPDADALQAELEPPEMHDGQQQEERPGQVDEIDAVPRRMLDEAGETREQPGDAEAGHDADDDPDMDELIVGQNRIHAACSGEGPRGNMPSGHVF